MPCQAAYPFIREVVKTCEVSRHDEQARKVVQGTFVCWAAARSRVQNSKAGQVGVTEKIRQDGIGIAILGKQVVAI